MWNMSHFKPPKQKYDQQGHNVFLVFLKGEKKT